MSRFIKKKHMKFIKKDCMSTFKEIIEMLQISHQTLRRGIQQRKLPLPPKPRETIDSKKVMFIN